MGMGGDDDDCELGHGSSVVIANWSIVIIRLCLMICLQVIRQGFWESGTRVGSYPDYVVSTDTDGHA